MADLARAQGAEVVVACRSEAKVHAAVERLGSYDHLVITAGDWVAAGGSVTLTGRMLAHRRGKGTVMATTMAGAIEFLARGLAMDLAPVRVNAVCLGLILTEIVKQRPGTALQAMVALLPVPRAASPTEAAMAYVYLMTNAYVTGQILPVDGGGMLV